MRVWLIALPCFVAMNAFAQRIVVRKVHGTQATVEVRDGEVQPGDEFELSPTDPSTSTVGNVPAAPKTEAAASPAAPTPAPSASDRSNLLGLSMNLSSLNSSAAYGKSTANKFGVNLRTGWNAETFEYGFLAGLQLVDKGTGLATTASGGFFTDWNWTPNRPGQTFVYGLGLQAEFGATNLPGDNGTSSTLTVVPALFGKWFFLGNATALRIDVGYEYTDDNSTGEKVQITGLKAQGGLAVYY